MINSSIENKPLSASDQIKISVFSILFAPSIFLLVGIIPALFLAFGIFMMKKNEDFSYIEVAFRASASYIGLLLIGCLAFSFLLAFDSYGRRDSLAWGGLAAISLIYLILINVLFFNPLKSHKEWIKTNGIFSSKPKVTNPVAEPNIVKSENLKQYSVANELIKWAKLKDDGHISEEMFNKVRNKLLNGS